MRIEKIETANSQSNFKEHHECTQIEQGNLNSINKHKEPSSQS